MTKEQIDDMLQSAESDEQYAPTFDYTLLRNAVNDIAKQQSIAFATFISREGWQQYDGPDRWICITESNDVISTGHLYNLFLELQSK
jgi:hypothetical protein